MLREFRGHQTTTILTGDFNIHSWGNMEKEIYQEWMAEENPWELLNPTAPTFRARTVTDGILLALGAYHPEGLLPQEADPEIDGGRSEVHPVFASEKPVLADRHT